jgi:hypothetical protein
MTALNRHRLDMLESLLQFATDHPTEVIFLRKQGEDFPGFG